MPIGARDSFETLLDWGRLAAAHARDNPFCVAEHRRALLRDGESPRRIDRIAYWEAPETFSDIERAVISFSETLSSAQLPEEMKDALGKVQQHLEPDEIKRLSASVLAVNEWINMRGQKPIRLLVVEDNLDDQELLNHHLRKTPLGDSVLFLSDPRIALDLIQAPDSEDFRTNLIAIMLDLHLPHMSGLEVLAVIRSLRDWKDFPVIMMTTDDRPGNKAIAEELKVMAFVPKPLTMTSFAHVVAPLFHLPAQKFD